MQLREYAAYVDRLIHKRLYELLLDAFQAAAHAAGYEFVEGGVSAPLPAEIQTQLGREVMRARARFSSPLLTGAELESWVGKREIDGDAEAWSECLLVALSARDVSIRARSETRSVMRAGRNLRTDPVHNMVLEMRYALESAGRMLAKGDADKGRAVETIGTALPYVFSGGRDVEDSALAETHRVGAEAVACSYGVTLPKCGKEATQALLTLAAHILDPYPNCLLQGLQARDGNFVS